MDQYLITKKIAKHGRQAGMHNPTASSEMYGVIPSTPLDAWLQVQYNLRTGSIDAQTYVGLMKSF